MFAIYEPKDPIRWHWTTLDGPDARDFLQRLSTVNLKNLQVGQGSPGCFLNAQGRLQVFFTLWRYGDTEFAFEFDGGTQDTWKDGLLKFIDQYTFAERMKLTVLPNGDEFSCRWIFFDDEAFPQTDIGFGELRTKATDEEIRLCHHGRSPFGKNWVSAWGRPARLQQWIDQNFSSAQGVDSKTLESWRVENLGPWVGHELTAEVTPLEAGAPASISQGKGCYPGQEVIERTLAIGSPARRLALIESDSGSAPGAGESVLNMAEHPLEIGTITTAVAKHDGGFLALALIRKIQAQPGTELQTAQRTKVIVKRVAAYE